MARPIRRRESMSALCARLTLSALFLAAPGVSAWSQVVSRAAAASSASGASAAVGSSLSQPAVPSLVGVPALGAPSLAVPSAVAPAAVPSALNAAVLPAASAVVPGAVPSAAAPAAAPTAVQTLKSAATRAAALSKPETSASEGRAQSARTFDSAAARPSDSGDAVLGSFGAGAPALGRLAAPMDGPTGSSPSGGDLNALVNALSTQLGREHRGGALLTREQLIAKARDLSGSDSRARDVVAQLVEDGRLMRLSGDRYVFSDLSDRFSASYGDEKVDAAGKRAFEAVRLVNSSRTKLPERARGVAALSEALADLKTSDAAGLRTAVTEVDVLMKNAALELLRDVLREAEQVLRSKQSTGQDVRGRLDKIVDARRQAMVAHVGPDGKVPSFEPATQAWLEELIGSLNPSKKYADQEEGRQIAKGLGVLYSLLAPLGENTVPEESQPRLLLTNGSATPAETPAPKVEFKALDKSEYKALSEYGTDITQKAADGKIRPMIGRKAEIRQMVKTLLRVEKNNPLVIGEKGVGKTAIINGLAQMIINGEIPELAGKNIVKIDLNKVVAGTQYRGQFEERMQNIIADAKKSNGRVILFIDEIHMIVGAGGASGSADASQILKESLSDGSLSLIGATTMDEFRRIEKDGALMRRFNPVKLLPPTKDEAEAIVEGVKSIYEKKHHVEIPTDAVKAAVALASRYVTDRHLPDSALDLMDDAAAEVELQASEATAAGAKDPRRVVTQEDIAKEISLRTGIPAGKLNEDKKTALKDLPKSMKGQVIGQDEAVEKVAEAVQQGETGYRDPKQPIASFVFLGPTGVGKTELARALAKIKFGSEKNMLRLDMSEYQEKHSVSRLISAPPGYVGHDEGGQLTESVRRNPYQVILLDEIEKAHPDVFDVLLQVLEDGRLTDGQGRTVDFSNTIIIMTSNIGGSVAGADSDSEKRKSADGWYDGKDGYEYKQEGIGFHAKVLKRPKAGAGSVQSPERVKHYLEAFKAKYRPEFVNRVGEDRVIVFNELTEKTKLSAILDLRLAALESQLKDKGLKVSLTDKAREWILNKALSQAQYGARPIKQIVDREINRALKDAELDGRIADGDKVLVDWSDAAGRFLAGKAQ